jgi:hypothetical protein
VTHLFEDGVVPEELASITDPIEYNYFFVRLKRDFNESHKSDYLKYINLQLPYHSSREEIGGAITHDEWGNFIDRLEGIIDSSGSAGRESSAAGRIRATRRCPGRHSSSRSSAPTC